MHFEFDGLRSAFTEQSTIFLDLVNAAPDLAAPTALAGWDCAVLIGHVSTAIEALWRWQGDPPDGTVELDAVRWWDAADPAINDNFAQRYADKRSHQELRNLIAAAVHHAHGFLPEASPDMCLVAPGAAAWASFDQALATRTFELTVHGLDLARATGSSSKMATAALEITGSILDQRLDGSRPADIDAEHDWVLAATGRTPHPDPRLPVVS